MNRTVVLLICVLQFSKGARYGAGWTYDDEGKWPGLLCHNGGTVQSPINIRQEDSIVDFEQTFIRGTLNYLGYDKVLFSGKNTGRTLQFTCDGPRLIHPELSGGPLRYRYRLEQMHFHSISEHAIDGNKYPLEVHLVHIRSDLSVGEALQVPDGLAIVAVFYNVHIQKLNDEELALTEIMPLFPKFELPGSLVSGFLLDLMKLLPENKNDYFTYHGSLTSPTCNEAVIWIIYEKPLVLSELQYRTYSQVTSGSNFRSLQPLRSHRVYRPYVNMFEKPKVVTVFKDMFQYVKQLYKNITMFGALTYKGVKKIY